MSGFPAVPAPAKQGQRMPLDDKISRISNRGDLIGWKADVDINNAMALRTREMMMMLAIAAHTVVMRAIGELDTCEQFHIDQLFDRSINCSPAYARFDQS